MVRIVAGFFALLAILVVAVAAVPFVVPADWIRAQVVAAVEGATGFRLALDGPVSFTLVPEPALEAVDVGVAAGDAPEFARVGTVRFGLALAPLLDRRVELTGLALESPRLVLTVGADGRRNWVPVASAEEGAVPAAEPAAPGGGFALSVARFAVEDGSVSWTDERSGISEVVERIAVETSLADLAAPLTARGGLALRGVPLAFDATLASPATLIAGGTADVRLALSAEALVVGFDGAVDVRAATARGRLTAGSDDLIGFAALAGLPKPPFRAVDLSGDVAAGADRVDLGGLKAEIDGIAVTGGVSVALPAGARPRIDARLAVPDLDLDRAAGRLADAREEGGRPAPGGDPRLDPAVLGVVDGGLDLTVGAIRGAALGDAGTLDGLHLVVVAEGGAATAVLDGVRLAGGGLAVRVKARPEGERLRLDGSVAAEGFDVGALARLAGTDSPLAGKLGADLAFAAAGRTASALAESLDASGTVTLAGGSFAGTGLAGLFGDPAADRAEAIAVKATVASLGEPVRAEGSFRLAGRPFGFDATVDARRVLDGHAFPLAVRVTGGKVGLGFDGEVLPTEGAASGRIQLRAPSLGALAAVLGRPAEGLPAGALAVTAAIDASARSVAVDGLQVKLGDGGFSGDVSLDLGDRPRVGARLRGPLIDIGGMIAGAAGAAGPGAPTAATTADWSDAPLGLEGLRAFDADVSLSADALRYGALTSGPAEARITVAGGKLAVDLPSVALHRGTLTGRVGVDAGGETAAVDVAVRLERVDLAPVLAATLGTGRIGGRASAGLALRGAGGSVRALMRDLAGTASVRVEGGALLGIDVRALLASAASAVVDGLGASPDASTPFTTLAASFDVARGVATTADLALDAPALTARGAGSVDIGGKALALTVTPKLTAPGGGDALSFEVPVVIEGPWAAPRIYPDVADILSDPAAAYAKLSRMGGAFAALAGARVGAGGAGDLGAVFDRLAPGLGGALAGGGSGSGVVAPDLGALLPGGAGASGDVGLDDLLGALGGGAPRIPAGDPAPLRPNDPGAADPGPSEPGVVDPGPIEPGVVDPGPGDPGSVQGGDAVAVDPGPAVVGGIPVPRPRPGPRPPVDDLVPGGDVGIPAPNDVAPLPGGEEPRPEKPQKPGKPQEPGKPGPDDGAPRPNYVAPLSAGEEPRPEKPQKPGKPQKPAKPAPDIPDDGAPTPDDGGSAPGNDRPRPEKPQKPAKPQKPLEPAPDAGAPTPNDGAAAPGDEQPPAEKPRKPRKPKPPAPAAADPASEPAVPAEAAPAAGAAVNAPADDCAADPARRCGDAVDPLQQLIDGAAGQ